VNRKNRRSRSREASRPKLSPVAAPKPARNLSDVKLEGYRLDEADNWDGLLLLAEMPLDAFQSNERDQARVFQLFIKVRALTRRVSWWQLDANTRNSAELRATFEELSQIAPAFYNHPEFDFFVGLLRNSFQGNMRAFELLSHAFREGTPAETARLIGDFRRVATMMMMWRDEPDGRTDDEIHWLKNMPPAWNLLREAYEHARQVGDLADVELARLLAYEVDIDMRSLDPWDVDVALAKLKKLAAPNVAQLAAMRDEERQFGIREHLTPTSWAFMYELRSCGEKRWEDIANRYPASMGSDLADGLHLVLSSLIAPPQEVDTLLLEGVRVLSRVHEKGDHWVGYALTVLIADQPVQIPTEATPLLVPSAADLLLQFAELAPDAYPRREELLTFYRVHYAASRYEAVEDVSRLNELEGLQWLCDNSLAFQRAVADVLPFPATRLRLLLDAICKHAESGTDYGSFVYLEIEGELSQEEAFEVLEPLAKLAATRNTMTESTERTWYSVLGPIFKILSLSRYDEVRRQALVIARAIRNDFYSSKQWFRIAYMEQTAGDAGAAVNHYLTSYDTNSSVETVLGNLRILVNATKTVAEAEQVTARIAAHIEFLGEPAPIRRLLDAAKERLVSLKRQEQFEKTAVNRWPSVTAPARKLLGALAVIDRYGSWDELGSYASMDGDWARRHYQKLLDEGMLFESDKGWRVNPIIKPLLDRESQHSVVSRIIRTQGTSAVKQVFNSQREFGIYQVMVQLCPNYLIFPNCSLQSIFSYDRMKELVVDDDFGYYLRASVDLVVMSTTTYLPLLAIEVDSVWHDTEKQQVRDERKDRIFSAGGVPFMRLQPVGSPSEATIRGQVAEHLDELVRSVRHDMPGHEQAKALLEDLTGLKVQTR